MKELTIEEKAKRYDEALENARHLCAYPTNKPFISDLKDLFPELVETEDERMLRVLIEGFNVLDKDDEWYGKITNGQIQNWLKKQGDKISAIEGFETEFERQVSHLIASAINREHEYNEGYVKWTANALLNFAKHELEKQGEQKPVDKIEPKFKVGDWIIFNGLILFINDVVQGYYRTISISNIHNSYDWDIDNAARFWTIQDAKDGDVLATLDYILIFKRFLKNNGGISYCHYDFGAGNPQFIWFEDKNWYFGKEAIIHPATKEQRDLLFQKMKEAGYAWDPEKKELKNIKQEKDMNNKLTDFEYSLKHIMEETIECGDTHNLKADADMLIRLAQKSTEWSEDDKKVTKWVIDYIGNCPNISFDFYGGVGKEAVLSWLNKLKDILQLQLKQ